MKHARSIFLFHKDLRLVDNTGLLRALEQSAEVLPVFIFDDSQIHTNVYKSDNAVQFMIESLKELAREIKSKGGRLYFFTGQTVQVLEKIITTEHISAVFSNADYTPFSRKRDGAIADLAAVKGIPFTRVDDALLVYPHEIATQKGTPYTVYTPFKNRAKQALVPRPEDNPFTHYCRHEIKYAFAEDQLDTIVLSKNATIAVQGGRNEALALLCKATELQHYSEWRDFPAKVGTSHLSAHNKFGTVSIREVYHELVQSLGEQHQIINELYWRDFFAHIAYHFPHVFTGAFYAKYNQLQWSNNEDHFTAWKTGTTGFPIVDAGMRELHATGYMHNRVRMVTASFLVKDLHLHWQKGEQYFAQKLVDYDPAVNNGNWQWAASTGCDAQPYFRIFNPWSQQKRFDPNCEYIKKWIPELAQFEPKVLHNWYHNFTDYTVEYPAPIVDHTIESRIAKDRYKQCA